LIPVWQKKLLLDGDFACCLIPVWLMFEKKNTWLMMEERAALL
jgi:hypothetical protein